MSTREETIAAQARADLEEIHDMHAAAVTAYVGRVRELYGIDLAVPSLLMDYGRDEWRRMIVRAQHMVEADKILSGAAWTRGHTVGDHIRHIREWDDGEEIAAKIAYHLASARGW
ncbi:hypothetical protein AB0H69_00275 [Streptomyces phaeochromogenes]|uniref:hypothetical protein n=1 Tax=Streptomyces phaeochromogenes TaxID=1923 RepID=UPI0033FDB49B